ncbi:terpene synthase family protein [Streptosporangium lutulentum]
MGVRPGLAHRLRGDVVGGGRRRGVPLPGRGRRRPPVPGDDLTRLLADIRDELAASPVFPVLGPIWREELQRMLEAMLAEWRWKDAGTTPTFEEYLGNAANLGFSFAFASHWLHTADPDAAAASTWSGRRAGRSNA